MIFFLKSRYRLASFGEMINCSIYFFYFILFSFLLIQLNKFDYTKLCVIKAGCNQRLKADMMFCFFKIHSLLLLIVFQLLIVNVNAARPNMISKIMKTKKSEALMRKMAVLHNVVTTVQVCYSRYLKCSRKLSNDLCASPTRRMAFYLWARRMAGEIMNGKQDNYNVTCSPYFVREILHGSLSPLIKSLKRS